MNVKIIIFGLIAPWISHGALSKPVYLNCEVSNDADSTTFSVMFDESSGNVTHKTEQGGEFNTKGFFTANWISYQRKELLVVVKYDINRTTLEAVKTKNTATIRGTKIIREEEVQHGSCKIVDTTGRKI